MKLQSAISNPRELPAPPSGWTPKTVEELCIRVTSGGTPARSNPDYFSGGTVNWFKTGELKDRLLLDSEEKITETALQESSAKIYPRNTLLMAMYGDGNTITGLGLLKVEAASNQACCAMIPNEKETSPEFLYYALKFHRDDFIVLASGGAQRNLNAKSIKNFSINTPQLPEQRAIARILATLDAKIENIRCQNHTIEKLAVETFCSWFINFDPVRSKTEGRPPFGMEHEVAELFPDHFGNSDLGEIPAGWKATTLADIVTECTVKVGNGNEHVVLSAVASGELKRSDEHFTKQVYSQDTSKYKRVEQWDYAYNPSRINIGSIGMLEEPIVGAVSPVYTVLRPAEVYEWFLRFFLDLPQTKEVINQFCSGSVRQSLSFKDFAAIPVVLPPKEIAEAFTRRWQELNGLRQKLAMQSSKLAEVRDTLLPKLMSGELRVPDELMA